MQHVWMLGCLMASSTLSLDMPPDARGNQAVLIASPMSLPEGANTGFCCLQSSLGHHQAHLSLPMTFMTDPSWLFDCNVLNVPW